MILSAQRTVTPRCREQGCGVEVIEVMVSEAELRGMIPPMFTQAGAGHLHHIRGGPPRRGGVWSSFEGPSPNSTSCPSIYLPGAGFASRPAVGSCGGSGCERTL